MIRFGVRRDGFTNTANMAAIKRRRTFFSVSTFSIYIDNFGNKNNMVINIGASVQPDDVSELSI